jgi:spore maturation protein CgeD
VNPKVSIILTTHGEAPYLKQAIGSVLAQTFEEWECIVGVDVKDGFSTDCDKILEVDGRITCDASLPPPIISCRFAAIINRCFKFCKGDYITYLCHDDLYLPWRLGEMVHAFEQGNHSVVFGHQQLLSEVDGKTWFGAFSFDRLRIGNPDQPAGTVDHSSVMHRRECFEKAGGWDENAPMRYGDAYFWLRLQNAGYKFHCIPEVLDVHRFNPHSISWKEDHPT